MVGDLHFVSFKHRSPTDANMCSVLKLACIALVFATTVSANERSKRSGLVDLGSSVLLPWGSSNNRGIGNKIYGALPSAGLLRIGNRDDLNLNDRNVLLQRQGDLVRLANEYNIRKQNLALGALNSDSIQDSLRQNSNVRSGWQQQNGYSGLGVYSRFNSNPSVDEQQALIGKNVQRQSQLLDQVRDYQLSAQNSDGGDAQLNLQSNKIISLGGQLNRDINQGQRIVILRPSINAALNSQGPIDSNKLNRYRQVSGLGLGLSGLNQEGLRNNGNIATWNKLEQNVGRAYGLLNGQNLVRDNQESLEQVNAEQNIQRNYGGYGGRGRFYQSLRSLDNQQLNGPVAEDVLSGVYNRQYPSWSSDRQSAQLQAENQNLGANNEQLGSQLQNQDNVNQQQSNSYTYGELSARIWNVIKSNPAMISNLDNLREQLLNGNNSGNEQMGQLKALLQDARNKNILIPRNNIIGQSLEEQERNVIVNNLIDAMNQNEAVSNPLDARGQLSYKGW
ncbi:uncharacterized protein LOC123670762 [Harmonia axyridis]|uniref:uncharacterized protein LOC123670762 n=1 Tax=Harmonia axyridis TaxID=115357 RepID=UPI001E2799C9|nr:uncharacterized protein LOC123670762 [Harmonia axyridis]